MHLCSEILLLILFPLLPALAIITVVVIVIVHLMIIASPALSFCARLNPATPSPPNPNGRLCLFWGGGRDTTLRPPRRKPTICQLLIVVCSLSVIFDATPAPPPQELPHRHEGGGGRIATPPPPRASAAPAASPAPRRGSSFSSPPRYSCRVEPWRSATWPMINAAGFRGNSSLSGGALAGAAQDLAAHHAVGSPRGWRQAAELGAGAGTQVFGRGRRSHRAGWNMPASLPAGRRESRTRTCTGQRHG